MGLIEGTGYSGEGYTDVTGNVPLEKMIREIEMIEAVHSPKEIIIRYDPKCNKATIYLTDKDFRKKTSQKRANKYIANRLKELAERGFEK